MLRTKFALNNVESGETINKHSCVVAQFLYTYEAV